MVTQRESARRLVKLPALIGGVLTVGTMLLAAPAASVAFAPTAFAAPPSDPGPGSGISGPGNPPAQGPADPGTAPAQGPADPGTAPARVPGTDPARVPGTFTPTLTGTGTGTGRSVDRNRSRQHHGVNGCLKIPAIGKC